MLFRDRPLWLPWLRAATAYRSFFFLICLLIPFYYTGFHKPHLSQCTVFYRKPPKITSFRGTSCFYTIAVALRLSPAPWPFLNAFLLALSQLMLRSANVTFPHSLMANSLTITYETSSHYFPLMAAYSF